SHPVKSMRAEHAVAFGYGRLFRPSLKLAGYEVYRFAGVELQGPDAPIAVKSFFQALFKRHGIIG
ncbi:hypothetical protein, partial [Cupriavidus sp. AcVe19-6a]|uniref:hypothetical protein n=1 Tax=Cupriavidus sp. AcVe19-6a TaxID=2821358 RepID=UPI001AE550D1